MITRKEDEMQTENKRKQRPWHSLSFRLLLELELKEGDLEQKKIKATKGLFKLHRKSGLHCV